MKNYLCRIRNIFVMEVSNIYKKIKSLWKKNKDKVIYLILLFFCLYSLFFIIGSTFAPVFAHYKQYDISAKLTSLYIYSCHQQPDKSFWIMGYPIALCCRCLGFYIGVSLSSIFYIFHNKKLQFKFFVFILLFVLLDLISNCLIKYYTHNAIRFIVGLMMGLLFTSIICYVFRNKKGEKDSAN